MPEATNGEITIYFEDEGSGEPVLLIHGHTMDQRIWDPVMPGLLARVTRGEGIEAAMMGPWASNPLFEYSFSKPGVRETAMAINRDFPGAEYLATERDRVERGWAIPERLSEIVIPTAVIAGDHETPGFRAYAEEAAASIPGARLEFFEDCGHLLPLEEPERVAQTVIEIVRLAAG
jgi:pimeloyl-ACP methyl ester carboxylesterase